MVLKRLFRSGPQPVSEAEYTIDDLIVLERYDEAAGRLQARIKNNSRDFHAHQRLAEVWAALGKPLKALDEYLFVADSFADDGFQDKAIAILTKAAKLAPRDEEVQKRLLRLQKLKQLDHSREQFFEGMAERDGGSSPLSRRSKVELQAIWKQLVATRFVQNLAPEQLRRLAAAADLREWQNGEGLALRGAEGGFLVVVVQGSIEAVLEKADGGHFSLRTFSTGDLIGESTLLEHTPWPATLIVREPTQGLVLDRGGLERALLGNADPRGFIEALRSQRHDAALASAVSKLLSGP